MSQIDIEAELRALGKSIDEWCDSPEGRAQNERVLARVLAASAAGDNQMQTDTLTTTTPLNIDDVRPAADALDSRLTIESYAYPDDSYGITVVAAPWHDHPRALVFSASFSGPHMQSCLMVLEPGGDSRWRTVTDLQAELRRLL
jgi:hypothetical protein